MKRSFPVAVTLLFAANLSAGIVYKFESVTDGLIPQSFAGNVKAESDNVRVEVTSGENLLLFTKGMVLLSSPSRTAVTVIDPAKRTYYELDPSSILNSGAVNQFGGFKNVDLKNPKVSVADGGAAGSLEGYAVRRSRIVSSFDIAVDLAIAKTVAHVALTSDVWSTDKLPAQFANVMQTASFRTGVEGIDRIIASYAGAVKGFPLKQVTTSTMTIEGGITTTSTTTSRVTDIRQSTTPASDFAVPKGFQKVESPLKALGASR